MTKPIKRLRLYWLIALGLLLLWLLSRAIVPFGKITYQTDFKDQSYFIGKLSPAERVVKTTEGQKIIGEPVYWSLFTPRPFNKATVTLTFSSPASLVELGVRGDKTTWNYGLKPVYSELLEKLLPDQKVLSAGSTILWQKTKKYNSVADFLKSNTNPSSVMVYHYPLANNYTLTSPALLAQAQTLNLNLRGAYQLYTYSSGQPIDLTFYVRDRNENADPDPIEINLYRGTELITQAKLEDTTTETERLLNLRSAKLSAGVYRVEVKVNNDIITTRLKTNQSKIVFPGALWLTSGTNLKFYSDAQRINAQTNNPASCQLIKINDQVLNLKETYHQYTAETNDTTRQLKTITVPKGDIVLASDSVIALTPDSFFDPTLKQLSALSQLSNLGADYLVANYEPVTKLADNTFSKTIEFNLSSAYREQGKYSFMLSAPQLNGATSNFVIQSIKVELAEPNLLEFISHWLKKYEIKSNN